MKRPADSHPDMHDHPRHVRHSSYYNVFILKELIQAGFVKVDDDSPSVDAHMKETLEHFIRYLKNTASEEMEGVVHFEDSFLQIWDTEQEDSPDEE